MSKPAVPGSSTPAAPGLWPSPISARTISQGIGLSNSAWDSDGQTLVWMESRGDRTVLVASRLNGDAPRDLTDELSVRARLGYGGGDFCAGSGVAIFVSGGRLYAQSLERGKARVITPAFGDAAAPTLSPNGKWVLYVFSAERKDGLALTDISGRFWPQKVAEGHDFFMQPTFSRDGRLAAWVAWDHPQMPWDGTRLYLAEVHEQSAGLPFFKDEQVLTGDEDTTVFQPEFSPDGKYLSYLSDESGWYNLYLYDMKFSKKRRLSNESKAQLGAPPWVQGLRTYGWSYDSKSIYCVRNERGVSSLVRFDVASGRCDAVRGLDEYTDLQQPALNPARAALSIVGSSGKQPARLVVLDLGRGTTQIVKRASTENIDASTLVTAQPVQWTAKKQTIHGLLYLPELKARAKDAGGTPAPQMRAGGTPAPQMRAGGTPAPQFKKALPPAIVRIHGGPTSQARAGYTADTQFFATRGYTVLDVNYRGSTGYGRAYMNALRGNWGVCDVEDAISAAQFLVQKGYADPKRLVILGGSAGGYTVLLALALHPGVFKAGICLYGVTDLFSLASDTHKMEERYLDSLVGPLPESAELYRERSPRFHADKIKDPLAIFHGAKDEVVPLSQSDAIVASLKRRGVPHEYHVYEGEGHGWRKKETVEAYYGAVAKFLERHVLFA